MTEDWAPSGVDTSRPSAARLYDYYLGGKDNYAVDREAAEEILAAAPEIRVLAEVNRAFLQRAVRFLVGEAGVRQFIDVGSGLPTQGNVHEIAQREAPGARVAYVDNDPIVLAHNRELLSGTDATATVRADVCRPNEILTHPTVDDLIKFDEPVAVLFVALLHFVTDDDDPAEIVARFREAMAPGSYVVISHIAPAGRPGAFEQAAEVYKRATSQLVIRTREQIRELFPGLELVEPGLVRLPEWRPDSPGGVHVPEQASGAFAGVGRKP